MKTKKIRLDIREALRLAPEAISVLVKALRSRDELAAIEAARIVLDKALPTLSEVRIKRSHEKADPKEN
jgi:hypothetical protein